MRYLLALLTITLMYSCKKEDKKEDSPSTETPVLKILAKNSVNGTTVDSIFFASTYVYGSTDYERFEYLVEKNSYSYKSGTAFLNLDTDLAKHWYLYFLNRGSLRIIIAAHGYFYTDVQADSTTPYLQTVNLLPYPVYTFDFTNITGDHLDDSLVFRSKKLVYTRSGDEYWIQSKKIALGRDFNNQSINMSWSGGEPHDYPPTSSALFYELKKNPEEIPLDTGYIMKEPGTYTHVLIEF